MSGTARFQVEGAVSGVVQQGEYLWNITIQPKNVEDAEKLLAFMEEQRAKIEQPSLPRQLIPEVIINRWQELKYIQGFFEKDEAKILYIFGIAGIGKSVLVRGALEQRGPEIPLIWINCSGLDIQRLLSQMNTGFNLGVQAMLQNAKAPIEVKIATVLGAIKNKSILVLDEFEKLLDDNERYLSEEMQTLIKAFCDLQHKVKVLITTRRLPYDINEASDAIKVLRLKGLLNDAAKEHFKKSAEQLKLPPNKISDALGTKAFEEINGHPLFLEMFASSLRDLPVKTVADELLAASDIGEYVTEQALKGLTPEELGILQVASIFRREFDYEVLSSVYERINSDEKLSIKMMRALIRRFLVEATTGKETAYYVHPLLRDAVPFKSETKAAAHSEAASWFLSKPFDPRDPETWDDGLYHLRKAAETKQDQETYKKYEKFVDDNYEQLAWAGWERRVVKELKVLTDLAKDDVTKMIRYYQWGCALNELGKPEEALAVLREINSSMPQIDKPPAKEHENAYFIIGLIKTRLGKLLVENRFLDEAKQVAEEVKPVVEFLGDTHLTKRYTELRFDIARKTEPVDRIRLLHWAKEVYKIADKAYQEEPTSKNRDSIAEAHFSLGLAYYLLGNMEKALSNYMEELRIKVEIEKFPGIADSLWNIGLLGQGIPLGGAFLLTWDQMDLEFKEVRENERIEVAEPIIKEFLSKKENIEEGRRILSGWVPKVLTYYERGLKRRWIE